MPDSIRLNFFTCQMGMEMYVSKKVSQEFNLLLGACKTPWKATNYSPKYKRLLSQIIPLV